MLYNVDINKQTAENRDELVEKLYLFLERYIPTRLLYENRDDQADCTQDTIMFILTKYDGIKTEIDHNKFNYEKYFYNRARSYVSYWIRRHSNERKAKREYIENAIYLQQHLHDEGFKPIDYKTLERIVSEYNFNPRDSLDLLRISQQYLEQIGYDSEDRYKPEPDTQSCENRLSLMEKIAYAVIDEYLIEVLGG